MLDMEDALTNRDLVMTGSWAPKVRNVLGAYGDPSRPELDFDFVALFGTGIEKRKLRAFVERHLSDLQIPPVEMEARLGSRSDALTLEIRA